MGILNLDLKAGLSPSKKICVICLIENLLEMMTFCHDFLAM